ncbi:MAG TPA: hypothetical protein VI702_02930, partial [Nitrospiria bacterium]
MPEPMDDEGRDLELRIYGRRVTWAIVLIGGMVFVGGLRWAGVDFDELKGRTRHFRPGQNVCLKTEWLDTTVGAAARAPFCLEWIDLKDTSGRIYILPLKDLEIVREANGKIHTQDRRRINYALFGTILLMGALILIGKRIQKQLIEKRRVRLGIS